MPIFEYKCQKCGTQFEHLVIPTTTDKPACPSCKAKGKNLEQVISLFATTDDNVTNRHMDWVKKESRNLNDERIRNEYKHADD